MNLPRPNKAPTPLSRTRTSVNGSDNSTEKVAKNADNEISTNDLGSLLGQMSIDDVSSGLHDLHGVSDKIDETAEMLQTKTMEMTNFLNVMTSYETKSNSAFRKAIIKSPEYVENLKIRFLRAEGYNSQAAAGRMIRFFDEKMKYFGEEKLVDDILFEDLGHEEIDVLRSGLMQLLPLRDRAGRMVIFKKGSLNIEFPNNDTVMRIFFYFMMAIHRDEENQKCGTVFIAYANGQKHLVPGRLALYWNLWMALPVQYCGFHTCQDSSVISVGNKIVAKLIESRLLCRTRVHYGSNVECIYNLMTFGIPRDALPVKEDGTMDLTDHYRMIEVLKHRDKQEQMKRVIERVSSPSPPSVATFDDFDEISSVDDSLILVPGPMDILLGTGRQQQKRPGMIRLNNLLDEYWDSYEAASKFEKTVIARMIYKLLRESNCRLLNVVSGGYEECDEDTAHTKIAHSFRSLRRKKKKASQTAVAGASSNSKTVETINNVTKRNFSDT